MAIFKDVITCEPEYIAGLVDGIGMLYCIAETERGDEHAKDYWTFYRCATIDVVQRQRREVLSFCLRGNDGNIVYSSARSERRIYLSDTLHLYNKSTDLTPCEMYARHILIMLGGILRQRGVCHLNFAKFREMAVAITAETKDRDGVVIEDIEFDSAPSDNNVALGDLVEDGFLLKFENLPVLSGIGFYFVRSVGSIDLMVPVGEVAGPGGERIAQIVKVFTLDYYGNLTYFPPKFRGLTPKQKSAIIKFIKMTEKWFRAYAERFL